MAGRNRPELSDKVKPNENSDLDLLVAWEPGMSLLDHAGLVRLEGDLRIRPAAAPAPHRTHDR